jgi:4-hydroxy 2-oxovalerate aldolase
MELNIIECTLRDGGYHLNWNFDDEFVKNYIKVTEDLNIKNIEFGFRFFENNKWNGEYAFTTEETLNRFEFKKTTKVGVMVFSGQVFTNSKFDESKFNFLFPLSKSESRLDFVRIATYPEGLDETYEIAKKLIQKGFQVSINLMQIHRVNKKQLAEFAINSKKINLDSIYFADSVGCLNPIDVDGIVKEMFANFQGPIGIHAHDNRGLAFANSIAALNAGATWIDGTFTGMGRGPGNTKTEDLILNFFDDDNQNYLKMIDFIDDYLLDKKAKYKWGSSPLYFLSGKHKIHPSYIQEMNLNENLTTLDKLNFIQTTDYIDKESFDVSNINYTDKLYSEIKEDVIAQDIKINSTKPVLIVGSGRGTRDFKWQIEKFINKINPEVLELNFNGHLEQALVNYHVYTNPQRFFSEVNKLIKANASVIIPSKITSLKDGLNIHNYEFKISSKNEFKFNNKFSELPNSLVLSYALALSLFSKNEEIYLVGFDGYEDTARNLKVNETFNKFENNFKKSLTSITPTKYMVSQKSIFPLI